MLNYIVATDFTDCQRLFHGRGHAYENLSHVNVDWLSPVILITLYQVVDEAWLLAQAQALHDLTPLCKSVQVQRRYEKFAPTQVLVGDVIDNTLVTEHGLSYHIELGKAQNSGLFLDMANGRSWVYEQAANKNVLNLFAYTCAFSVVAIAGGAQRVVNIDLSKSSLSKGRENHQLNKLSKKEGKQIIFEGVDIFKSNSRIKKYGKYDLLICDPPSFQKGSVNIERDYAKILRKIPQWMDKGAQLLLCLNSPDLDEQFLKNEVLRECPDCIFEHRLDNPKVFKEAHEGKGLKVLVFSYQPV
ncbi:class I SAM-dependent methyltransferase [Colwellia sp. MSW7]|jgi:23S rRNA (cytosine1962-C5)-methyltransferase|uniref:Class I SAM-dependent methyltransferase n=1 Tax=Colwellia maritima TaxID=2912588 RepID=A0ABS9X436_9GAMM|nr:class I SAM-dependent methyltransferase [Colwellia maritima]MCI2284956.1 class I SAM-dependent methyltransferase [Colwellia maritima]